MEGVTPIGINNRLARNCTCILDYIYQHLDCSKFVDSLLAIEANVVNNYYRNLEDFKQDLFEVHSLRFHIKELPEDFTRIVIPEDYCHTPIYNSINLQKESTVYTVHIDLTRGLNQPLRHAMQNPTSPSPILQRLFVKRNVKLLLEAKENIQGILVLFTNVQIKVIKSDQDNSLLSALVAIVHPLGNCYRAPSSNLDGWIKVKIIRSHPVNTVIPTELVPRLFYENTLESVQKIELNTSLNAMSARENEVTRQFISNILQMRADQIDFCSDFSTGAVVTDFDKGLKQRIFTCNQEPVASSETSHEIPTIPAKVAPKLFDSAARILRLLSEKPKTQIHNHWHKLEKLSNEKNILLVSESKYSHIITHKADAEGHFKQVYFTKDNKAVQLFQRSTLSQRAIEIACLLMLTERPNIGHINEIITTNSGFEVVGLTMNRYEMTLQQYLKFHSHHRLSAYQRMDIIIQLLKSMNSIHQIGVTHRDLSPVNFMVNMRSDKYLEDGSEMIDLYLIDFGKAAFLKPHDAKKWWVESDKYTGLYKDEVKPASREELAIWCKNLPYIMAKPDHGYRFYRSIETLPRSRNDHNLIPRLIDPIAEDMYSIGTIIWKVFSGVEPWPGIFDTDLKQLRETVDKDHSIDRILEQEVIGPVSKALLKKFLQVDPRRRKSAVEVLYWIQQNHIRDSLLSEWNIPEGSTGRFRSRLSSTASTPNDSVTSSPKQMPFAVSQTPPQSLLEAVTPKRPTGRPKGPIKPKPVVEKPRELKKTIGRPKGRLNDKTLQQRNKAQLKAQSKALVPQKGLGRPKGSVKKSALIEAKAQASVASIPIGLSGSTNEPMHGSADDKAREAPVEDIYEDMLDAPAESLDEEITKTPQQLQHNDGYSGDSSVLQQKRLQSKKPKIRARSSSFETDQRRVGRPRKIKRVGVGRPKGTLNRIVEPIVGKEEPHVLRTSLHDAAKINSVR